MARNGLKKLEKMQLALKNGKNNIKNKNNKLKYE
jgi:hypothetical protein